MSTSHGRPVVALLLPKAERDPVVAELARRRVRPDPARRRARARRAAGDPPRRGHRDHRCRGRSATWSTDAWTLLHSNGRLDPGAPDRQPGIAGPRSNFMGEGHEDDEYLTRPYSAESIRWRVEAMCIRSVAVDDGSGPVLQGELEAVGLEPPRPADRVVQPQGWRRQDDDRHQPGRDAGHQGARGSCSSTPTPSPATSPSRSGMDGVPTVVDAWRDELDGGPVVHLLRARLGPPVRPAGPAALVQPDPDRGPRPGARRRRPSRPRAGRVDFVDRRPPPVVQPAQPRGASTRPTGSWSRSPRTCRRSVR